ncbi:MAG: hypothetical protein ACRDQ5_27990 [Sciscionella sp.]
MKHLPTFHAREFRKARASDPDQNCVRVARKLGWAVVWDDKLADGHTAKDALLSSTELLYFTDEQFDAWQAGHRIGDTEGLCLSVTEREDGLYVVRAAVPQPVDDVELAFDQHEVDAFYDGVHNHEFDAAEFATA